MFLKRLFKKKENEYKSFAVEGEMLEFKHAGYLSKNLEIWYENTELFELLSNMPNAEVLSQAFEVYKRDSGLSYKYLLIKDDRTLNHNWFYKRNKTWVVTMQGVLQVLLDSLEKSGINVMSMDQYFRDQGIIVKKC